jgi:hypothetical protein
MAAGGLKGQAAKRTSTATEESQEPPVRKHDDKVFLT